MDRRLLIVTAVIGLHLLGLWALHTGLLRRAVALVIPVQVVEAEMIQAPQPVIAPALPAPPAPDTPALPPPAPPKPAPRQPPPPKPAIRPAPQPLASVVAEPTPQAPVAITAPQPITTTAPPAAEVATPAPPVPPALPAPPRVDLPSSSADYLNNPPPPYPTLSKRLNEQGRVVIRARIEVDGTASQAEVRTSSGFERLDQAALHTVKRWRYVPGKRAGVPEAMWFNIPIQFVLE
jgi:protein TonB